MTAPNKANTPALGAGLQTPPTNAKSDKPAKPAREESTRETIESIAVAFLLAFLFRAFEAEAFVIPTGSMAPTLYGRHKETNCNQCGHLITIGASEEVDDSGYLKGRLESSLCPNCRAPNAIRNAPVFHGDRILVNKFPYELKEPRRWDVVVFKYPEEPKTNYIKRLVGLPNETLIIRQGDLYRTEPGGGETRVLRKTDPYKQREVQILVYDNDFPERPLIENGWPNRWAAVEKTSSDLEAAVTAGESSTEIAGWRETKQGWQSLEAKRAFALQADAANKPGLNWLRYRHFVPTPEAWRAVLKPDEAERLSDFGTEAAATLKQPKAQLVTDFCGYNAFSAAREVDIDSYLWVGDLSVACDVRIDKLSENPELVLELNKGVHRFRCRIDPKTGEAQLQRIVWLNQSAEDLDVLAKATTKVLGTGSHRIEFANVDQRLCLWVDGSLVDFGSKAEYTLAEIENLGPQPEDLTPVGIAARGLNVEVAHLQIHRDIYYRSSHVTQWGPEQEEWTPTAAHQYLRSLLTDPIAWGQSYKAGSHEARFDIGPDEFMMLGDNSPRSKDSRLWGNDRRAEHRHAVPRSALVGKAFYIYWPHGQPFLNGGEGYGVWNHSQLETKRRPSGQPEVDKNGNYIIQPVSTDYASIRLPFYPNVGRMQRIR
ncbi:MAG: signal peptidase I [Planctomycetaceae bacterium]